MNYRIVSVFVMSLLTGCAQLPGSNKDVYDRVPSSSKGATQNGGDSTGNQLPAAPIVPAVSDVESQIKQGNYAEALRMMRQVIAAHPYNARAHYIIAQLLEREGQALTALDEIEKSKELAPVDTFTSSDAFLRTETRIRKSAGTAYGNRNMPLNAN
ncbi:tetratricopeptide repeat protein [Burkholderia lata]|uniref:tetratricopeptide repeat protein n=1 Tax=Burkholderia lata (strain ATCC 17760 / DSM 23089 / LMG 22485 / NCIMB 9086 / R18194 / 383) TaxID=482957 RepID=UPI0015832A6A|nr:tetratricopeptide repeat protein [Burkholderia lata]